jgi:hypothetical protein
MRCGGVIVRFPLGDGDPPTSMEGCVGYFYLGARTVLVRLVLVRLNARSVSWGLD